MSHFSIRRVSWTLVGLRDGDRRMLGDVRRFGCFLGCWGGRGGKGVWVGVLLENLGWDEIGADVRSVDN